jgi:hypothetical protein
MVDEGADARGARGVLSCMERGRTGRSCMERSCMERVVGALVTGVILFGLAAGCEAGDDALLVPPMSQPSAPPEAPPGTAKAPSDTPAGDPEGSKPSGVEGGGEVAPPLNADLAPAVGPADGAGPLDAGGADTGGADGGAVSGPPAAADAGAGDAGSPPGNDCCTPSTSGSCRDTAIAACVCEGDPFCCSTEYDATCVTQAISRCGLDCEDRAPTSDCCAPSDVPGCTRSDVQACICDIDPICCVFRFDQNCVNLATSRCGASCGDGGTP